MRAGVCCLGLVAALGAFQSAPAHACSCLGDWALVTWPRDSAIDVPLDTPLVIASSDIQRAGAALFAEDGTEIELVEKRRIDTGAFACSKPHYAFLSPGSQLAPNTHYRLVASYPTEEGVRERARTFTTGTGLRGSFAPVFQVHAYAAAVEGGRFLEAYLESDGSEPLFALARGEREVVAHQLDPEFQAGKPLRVSFGMVECGGLVIVDVAGLTLFGEELCEPSKCASSSLLGDDSCGGESLIGMGWESWQQVPDGCEPSDVNVSSNHAENTDPASGDARELDDLELDPNPLSEGASASATGRGKMGGCRLSRAPSSAAWLCGVGLALAARSRRRSMRRG